MSKDYFSFQEKKLGVNTSKYRSYFFPFQNLILTHKELDTFKRYCINLI